MTSRSIIEAAQRALHAPSVFNTQPWRWRIKSGTLELHADRQRQLTVTDPDGRLLTISCGTALHHARVALTAGGHQIEVTRLPEPADPDLLARIRVTGTRQASQREIALDEAIPDRRTDRRAFGSEPVPETTLRHLRAAVEAEGAFLHVVRPDQMLMLAATTANAGNAELDDPAYRKELHRWTHRPPWTGDGVPPATTVRPAPRRVPVRDYVPDGDTGLAPGTGDDRGAVYTVLFGPDDTPASWLRAGEALSALLLTAVMEGLSAAPLSDAIEVTWPRQLLCGLLAGLGKPYLVVRIGVGPDPADLPPAPRRDLQDAISTEQDRP